MKTRNMIIVFCLMAGYLSAAAPAEREDLAVRGYLQALKSENPGLRHDAIFKIACLKTQRPEITLREIEKTLEKVGLQDADLRNRLHAQMTLVYIRDSRMALTVKAAPREDCDLFFDRLYREISSLALAGK